MGIDDLNNKIESSKLFQFTKRNKKTLMVIEGVCIILLLISINIYVVKDYSIKKQIAANCGYETSKYTCICDKKYVEGFIEYQQTGELGVEDYDGELAR